MLHGFAIASTSFALFITCAMLVYYIAESIQRELQRQRLNRQARQRARARFARLYAFHVALRGYGQPRR